MDSEIDIHQSKTTPFDNEIERAAKKVMSITNFFNFMEFHFLIYSDDEFEWENKDLASNSKF
jgi:hypothetical protein